MFSFITPLFIARQCHLLLFAFFLVVGQANSSDMRGRTLIRSFVLYTLLMVVPVPRCFLSNQQRISLSFLRSTSWHLFSSTCVLLNWRHQRTGQGICPFTCVSLLYHLVAWKENSPLSSLNPIYRPTWLIRWRSSSYDDDDPTRKHTGNVLSSSIPPRDYQTRNMPWQSHRIMEDWRMRRVGGELTLQLLFFFRTGFRIK